jgi:DNA-binding MarR family transcriptional regulator
MNPGSRESKEAEDLVARFQRVMEASFKRMGENKMFPVTNKIFTSLTVNQIRALHILHHVPGMAQKVLAENLEVTPAAVSTAVKQLEKLGLVERRADEEDARQKRLYLSEYGANIITQNQKARNQTIARLLGTLTLEERRMIVEILERAVMRQQELEASGSPESEC